MARTPQFALLLLAVGALAPCVREPRRGAHTAVATHSDASGSDALAGGSSAADARDDAAPTDALVETQVTAPPTLTAAIEAVRREDWAAAEASLRGLSALERSTREARYMTARVALKRGRTDEALASLQGLAEELASMPGFSVHVARLRARALYDASRFDLAREAYEALATQSRSEWDRAMVAMTDARLRAFDRAAPVVRRWAESPPPSLDRVSAWRVAAETLDAVGDAQTAARAWRRIAIDEPDSRVAETALAALTRANAPLTAEETLQRAEHFNSRARYTEAIATITAMAPVEGALDARRLHVLGRAYFGARSRYSDAQATLAAAAARSENGDREEDAFLSARALARADRDEEAVVAYDRVAREVQGRWGDEAAFRAAWLVGSLNRNDEAIARYQAFLRDRPRASESNRAESAWQLGWALLQANRFGEASVALEQSSALSSRGLEKGRGKYWSAVAMLRGGDVEHSVAAFRAVISERPLTYYAMLAEARLRERGLTVDPPREPAEAQPGPPALLPEGVRFLHALGFDHDAGQMLAQREDQVRARAGAAATANEVLARAYVELGEAHRAYTLSQRHGDALDHEPTPATRWVWDCAYPRPHARDVEAAEDANGLPRHYLYAIMRQESTFNTRDVSSARAIGLLQMVPPTTRRVAQALNIEFREELLFEPAYNIRTGGYYIGRLFAQYHSVLPRAIGAFNAGPGSMGRWVSRWGNAELDTFVESIPFDETRTYVRRVLQNLARYRYLHGPREGAQGGQLRLALRASEGVDALVDY